MLTSLQNSTLTLTIDSLGAQAVSLKRADGTELLWTGDPTYWGGHAPVLFPIVGALRGGTAQYEGRTLTMGQHGFARRREFTVAEQTADAVTLTLQDDEETRAAYPFAFVLSVTYRLHEDGFTTEFLVQNPGDEPLPFAIGGHPGFNIPVGESADFTDYTIVFEQDEQQRCPGVVMGQGLIDPDACNYTLSGKEIPLTHELFYQDALIFEGLRSRTVQVVNKTTGHGVEMDISQFPLLGIWSAQNDGPYVCLEPWTGCATRTDETDDFGRKKNMRLLPPGEQDKRSFTVRVF